METLEMRGTHITEYYKPDERVLFSAHRDANPFFHFFEALWILAGRQDVAFLERFNKQIKEYSDDGEVFNAAYGYRLRNWQTYANRVDGNDQVAGIINKLYTSPDSRQAVAVIWQVKDLESNSKDIPCNDMIFFKVRDGALEMTVCCRSNDAIWGAYGANAVQFSTLQEYIACALSVQIGVYRQVSDSFHIYTDNEAWKRINEVSLDGAPVAINDLYGLLPDMIPFPLFKKGERISFDTDLREFCWSFDNPGELKPAYRTGYFTYVVAPMYEAHRIFKFAKDRNEGVERATEHLYMHCAAADWKLACVDWLRRRRK